MTGSIILLVVGAVGVSLLLKLLVVMTKVEQPGPKSTGYWAKALLLTAFVVAVIVAAMAVNEGWRP